jgi:putative DNA primase/helicase
MTSTENFHSAMVEAGIDYHGPIHDDGRRHRVQAHGDKTRNSWYIFHCGQVAEGAFGCWKRNIRQTWRENKPNLSAQDREQAKIEAQRRKSEQELADAKRRDDARRRAAEILDAAKPADPAHPYLIKKSVQVHGDLRVTTDGKLLILPLHDAAGTLWTLQFIDAAGGKRFLPGGRTAGCFFTVSDISDGPLVICEGYATGASIVEATGHAVVCAMHCGNLLSVAKSLRLLDHEREIILAADNDQHTPGNPGLTKATSAARAIGGKLAVPQF